ncbi:Hemolysin-activating lysine-acyltransferase HlyC [bacterium YEK0313]|nr:Hemolysin-activating lysine-acyltransferase HlyC [bacterium YEK0313]
MNSRPPPADQQIGYFEALGMLTELALHSALHRNWFVADIGINLVPALRTGQCKIYFDEHRMPTSFATWALVHDDDHKALRNHGRTPPPDRWASGAHLWFIDVVAPFGNVREIVRDLQRRHFPHLPVAHAVRRNVDGSMRRIQTWHNAMARHDQADGGLRPPAGQQAGMPGRSGTLRRQDR